MITGVGSFGSTTQAQMSQELFKKLDADGSGGISQEEFLLGFKKRQDTTGSISMDADRIFEKLDANKDGVIDYSEHEAAINDMAAPPRSQPPLPALGHNQLNKQDLRKHSPHCPLR
jgi:hypothetical protein